MNQASSKTRIIVVLGMHRSGTSAITRGLQAMGVKLGDRLMPPVEGNNPKGFWEDIDLNALNIEILDSISSNWNHVSLLNQSQVEELRRQGLLLRAAQLLRAKTNNVPVYGFKDPRVAKLLPFWKEVFDHCGYEVGYIIALRNPLSIAQSLAKRDGIDTTQSYLLWLGHVLTSLSGSAGNKRVLVDYDLLMQSPEQQLNRISCGLDLAIDPSDLHFYRTHFLDAGLRHTVYQLNDLLLDSTCPPAVREVYASLLDVAEDRINIDDPDLVRKIATWGKEFDRFSTSLNFIDRWLAEKTKLNHAMADRDRQIASLDQAVAERDGQIACLNQAVVEHEMQNTKLHQVNMEVRGELRALQNNLAAVYASRSWKVTRPLRLLNRVWTNRGYFLRQGLDGLKMVANSQRQQGFVKTVKKVINRIGGRGASLRYSSIPRSGVTSHPDGADTAKASSPKKLTLISMIKNEKSVIEIFAAHALAMFDRVIFVDHRSNDGSGEYLRSLFDAYPQVEYFQFDEAGYYQSEVMTWVVKNVVGPVDSGWVFFLDADEFLPFSSRAELDKELAKYASFPVISMPWLNLVPMDMEAGHVKGGFFLKPSKTAVHHKIAFQPELVAVDEYVVAQGNHALLIGRNHQQLFPAEEAFPIYHLPIRTKQQLRDKILFGVESYKKMGADRGSNLGFHWDEISRLIDDNGLTDELMADMIARYGEPLAPPYGKSVKTMIQEGHTEIRLDICTIEDMACFNEIFHEHDVESTKSTEPCEQEKVASKRNLPIVLDAEQRVLRFKSG